MTKEIELTKGMVALVDDKDYEWLSQWKWSASKKATYYYATRSEWIDEKCYSFYMHREILGLKRGSKMICDHINRDELDNRRCNLRSVSYSENSRNHRLRAQNKSGYNGVCWHILHKKWLANIAVNGKTIHLGVYKNIDDAVEARKQGEEKHWNDNPATFIE